MRRCLCVRWEDPVCPFFVRMFRCCYYVKEYIFRVCVSCVIFTEAGEGVGVCSNGYAHFKL